jgi:hypothetical protein
MRTWADHNNVAPQCFEVGFIAGGEVRFRLGFETLRDAAAFAGAFDGEVLVPSQNAAAA